MVESSQQGGVFIYFVNELLFFFSGVSVDLDEMYLKYQFSWNPSRAHENSSVEF